MPGYIVGGDAGSPTIIEGSAEAVTTHNADTTAVHGITDTATLVVGPASATDNAVARFDGTTGKLLQSGPVAITDAGKITGLADGTANSDAATVGQLATAGISPSILDAHTILKADTDNTPAALTVGASTIVGRKATGGISALTGAEVAALLSGIAPAAITGTAAILGANTFTATQTITRDDAAPVLILDTPSAGQWSTLQFRSNGVHKWYLGKDDTDTFWLGQAGGAPFLEASLGHSTGGVRVVSRATGSATFGLQLAAGQTGDALRIVAAGLVASVSASGLGTFSGLALADATDLAAGTATGAKIGTAAAQKLGFWAATPVVQPTAVADATDAATVISQLNALLARLRTIGLIAT